LFLIISYVQNNYSGYPKYFLWISSIIISDIRNKRFFLVSQILSMDRFSGYRYPEQKAYSQLFWISIMIILDIWNSDLGYPE